MLRYLAILLALVLPAAVHAQNKSACRADRLLENERGAKIAAVAQSFTSANPCAYGIEVKSLRSIVKILISDKREGGRRLNNEVPTGLPNGVVMPAGQTVRFDFGEVAGERLRSFQLKVDSRLLVNLASPALQIDVPVARYGPNNSFDWTLNTGRASYQGQFTLIKPEDQVQLEQQLMQVEKAPLDTVTKLIYKASLYDDAELYSNRDHALVEIRRMANL